MGRSLRCQHPRSLRLDAPFAPASWVAHCATSILDLSGWTLRSLLLHGSLTALPASSISPAGRSVRSCFMGRSLRCQHPRSLRLDAPFAPASWVAHCATSILDLSGWTLRSLLLHGSLTALPASSISPAGRSVRSCFMGRSLRYQHPRSLRLDAPFAPASWVAHCATSIRDLSARTLRSLLLHGRLSSLPASAISPAGRSVRSCFMGRSLRYQHPRSLRLDAPFAPPWRPRPQVAARRRVARTP